MVKVLIYSSKEIYDNATFEGRAEANIIAYREGDFYHIMKNKTSQYMTEKVIYYTLKTFIEWAERDEFQREVDSLALQRKYKDHPLMELSKNNGA